MFTLYRSQTSHSQTHPGLNTRDLYVGAAPTNRSQGFSVDGFPFSWLCIGSKLLKCSKHSATKSPLELNFTDDPIKINVWGTLTEGVKT